MMRNQWYGDKRDIVKWAALEHLAREHGAKMIVQIAMLCPDDPEPRDLILEVDGDPVDFSIDATYARFRDLRDVENHDLTGGVKVEVVGEEFVPKSNPASANSRCEYFQRVTERLRSHGNRIIGFLDPDTGLEPAKSRAGRQHVTSEEVRAVYDSLKPGDVLALYQHASRKSSWQEEKREQLAKILGANLSDVHSYSCGRLAHDVVLLVIAKP